MSSVPLLMTQNGKTLLEVAAEGRETSTTQRRLEKLCVHERPGLGLNSEWFGFNWNKTE